MRLIMKEVKKINDKILDLYNNYQLENENNFLEIIELRIKMYKLSLNLLESQKPFWFQRKKLILYHDKKQKLDKKILKLKRIYNKELEKISNSCNN